MNRILERLLARPSLQSAQIAGTSVRGLVSVDPRRALTELATWSEHPEACVRIASGVGYGVAGTRDRNLLAEVLPYVERLANDHESSVREHGAQAALEQLWLAHTDAMSSVIEEWATAKNDLVREVVVRTIGRVATGGQIRRPSILRRFIERGLALVDQLVDAATPELRTALAEAVDEIGSFAPELATPYVLEWADRESLETLRLVKLIGRMPFGGACEGLDLESVETRLQARSDVERTELATLVRAGVGRVDYLPILGQSFLTDRTNPHMPWAHAADPYQGCQLRCEFCHARDASEWSADGEEFVRRITVVRNAADLLTSELMRPELSPRDEHVLGMGVASDPYQPAEERFEVTRDLLKVCLELEHPVVIQTRQELILRDVDILEQLAERGLVNVLISMQTAIEGIRNKVELGASTISERFRTIRMLSKLGVPVGLLLSPIMPNLTDDEGILEEVIRRAGEAGAQWVVPQVLDLRGSARAKVRVFLDNYISTLVDGYTELYSKGRRRGLAEQAYIDRITKELVPELAARHGVDDTSRVITSGKPLDACMSR